MNIIGHQVRRLATSHGREIGCSVFISQSKDIFANLALEDWLYRNFNFKNNRILFLWQNTPCVVIGRHQNPWVESNVEYLRNEGILLARRNSGGGTVYHDMGNLNCTFFTPREAHDRKHNLQLISDALRDNWAINTEITCRDSININNKKISGTAAKLGKNSYHHCTLLVNSELSKISKALKSDKTNFMTNATESVPSSVTSISSVCESLTVDDVLEAVGEAYLRDHNTKSSRGYNLINPSEGWFPGIRDLKRSYRSWEWTFGKTPRFSATYTIPVTPDIFPDGKVPKDTVSLNANVTVANGIMEDIELTGSKRVLRALTSLSMEAVNALQGQRFCCTIGEVIEQRLAAGSNSTTLRTTSVCGEEQALIGTIGDDHSNTMSEESIRNFIRM